MKEEIWIAITALEGAGMHHRTNTERMTNIILPIFGNRELSAYFNVEKQDVENRLAQYIYNHEF